MMGPHRPPRILDHFLAAVLGTTLLAVPAHAADLGLAPDVARFIPSCARACVLSFISVNYDQSTCDTGTPGLQCLCANRGPSGFTLGEGAVQCIVAERQIEFCSENEAPDSIVNGALSMCDGQPSAVRPTHTELVATLVLPSSGAGVITFPTISPISSASRITTSTTTSSSTSKTTSFTTTTTTTSTSSSSSSATTTAGASPPAAPSESGPAAAGLDGGAIAGIVVGIIAVLFFVLSCICIVRRRRKQLAADREEEESGAAAPRAPGPFSAFSQSLGLSFGNSGNANTAAADPAPGNAYNRYNNDGAVPSPSASGFPPPPGGWRPEMIGLAVSDDPRFPPSLERTNSRTALLPDGGGTVPVPGLTVSSPAPSSRSSDTRGLTVPLGKYVSSGGSPITTPLSPPPSAKPSLTIHIPGPDPPGSSSAQSQYTLIGTDEPGSSRMAPPNPESRSQFTKPPPLRLGRRESVMTEFEEYGMPSPVHISRDDAIAAEAIPGRPMWRRPSATPTTPFFNSQHAPDRARPASEVAQVEEPTPVYSPGAGPEPEFDAAASDHPLTAVSVRFHKPSTFSPFFHNSQANAVHLRSRASSVYSQVTINPRVTQVETPPVPPLPQQHPSLLIESALPRGVPPQAGNMPPALLWPREAQARDTPSRASDPLMTPILRHDTARTFGNGPTRDSSTTIASSGSEVGQGEEAFLTPVIHQRPQMQQQSRRPPYPPGRPRAPHLQRIHASPAMAAVVLPAGQPSPTLGHMPIPRRLRPAPRTPSRAPLVGTPPPQPRAPAAVAASAQPSIQPPGPAQSAQTMSTTRNESEEQEREEERQEERAGNDQRDRAPAVDYEGAGYGPRDSTATTSSGPFSVPGSPGRAFGYQAPPLPPVPTPSTVALSRAGTDSGSTFSRGSPWKMNLQPESEQQWQMQSHWRPSIPSSTPPRRRSAVVQDPAPTFEDHDDTSSCCSSCSGSGGGSGGGGDGGERRARGRDGRQPETPFDNPHNDGGPIPGSPHPPSVSAFDTFPQEHSLPSSPALPRQQPGDRLQQEQDSPTLQPGTHASIPPPPRPSSPSSFAPPPPAPVDFPPPPAPSRPPLPPQPLQKRASSYQQPVSHFSVSTVAHDSRYFRRSGFYPPTNPTGSLPGSPPPFSPSASRFSMFSSSVASSSDSPPRPVHSSHFSAGSPFAPQPPFASDAVITDFVDAALPDDGHQQDPSSSSSRRRLIGAISPRSRRFVPPPPLPLEAREVRRPSQQFDRDAPYPPPRSPLRESRSHAQASPSMPRAPARTNPFAGDIAAGGGGGHHVGGTEQSATAAASDGDSSSSNNTIFAGQTLQQRRQRRFLDGGEAQDQLDSPTVPVPLTPGWELLVTPEKRGGDLYLNVQ